MAPADTAPRYLTAGPHVWLREDRWFSLLLMTRVLGGTVAVVLLIAHQVTGHDGALAAVTALWTAITLVAFGRSQTLRASAVAWAADMSAALALVVFSGDWRSPFYVFALTTLILPATSLPWRPALLWGLSFSVGYVGAAFLTRRLPPDTLGNTIRLETLATHLFVPIVVTLLLAYAGELLERLRQERQRAERLAIQTERQRIAWELHDSAKQRVHAAHLLVSSLEGRLPDGQSVIVSHAVRELRAATADMETSIAELRTPVDGRAVDDLVRERATELAVAGAANIQVTGRLPPLQPLVAAHTYRIAAEALSNAIRHGGSKSIRVCFTEEPEGGLVVVEDDGVGFEHAAVGAGHGLRSMRGRAETIGAELDVGPASSDRGTRVALLLPADAIATTKGAP